MKRKESAFVCTNKTENVHSQAPPPLLALLESEPPLGGSHNFIIWAVEFSLRLGHLRGKTVINCFLTLSGRFATPSPTNKTLPQVVSALKRLCNKEIGENIFQRSYYDHVIRDEEDYQTRVAYIYENPMRWYYDELYNE